MTGGGRTVVVIGGASGIGLATARRFVALNDRVVIADVNADAAAAAAAELGQSATSLHLDVTDEGSVAAGFDGLDRVDADRQLCRSVRAGRHHRARIVGLADDHRRLPHR